MRAARDVSSISSTRSRRSSAMVTIESASGGFTPQTTDDPPPNGTITWPLPPHQSTVAVSSASDVGCATTSGGFGNSRLKARVRSVRWAPCAWNARSHVSVVHHGASASGTLMRGGRNTASSRWGIGLATISVPALSESFVASSSRCWLVGSSLSRHQAQKERRGESTVVMARVYRLANAGGGSAAPAFGVAGRRRVTSCTISSASR